MEKEKPHERILKHFENTIDGFAESILNQNYVTKDDLKIKIKACVINSIKTSKKQGSHEAQLIIMSEKLAFRLSEYIRKSDELNFVTKLYSKTLNDNKLKEFWGKRDKFRNGELV